MPFKLITSRALFFFLNFAPGKKKKILIEGAPKISKTRKFARVIYLSEGVR